MKNITKVFYIICIIVIILGISVWKFKGVNYSIEYAEGKAIEIYFKNSIEKSDIEGIAKEIFGKDIKVYEIERFKDAFSIKARDISEEQKESLISKINEKYNLEFKTEDLTITDVPKVSGFDLINPYVKPILISLVLICIFLSIRYKKIGNIKTAVLTILKATIITLAYFGVVIIIRVPLVNMYIIPIGTIVAMLSLILICNNNENEIEKLNEENK